MSGAGLLATLALLPAMLGPLPMQNGAEGLVLALCGGGSVTIQPGNGETPLPGNTSTPCCAKGCRNSARRKQIDPRQ